MIDPKARADRWSAFYNEPGGLREMIEGLQRAYFERAQSLSVHDRAGLQKLSIASKIVGELDSHVRNIVTTGEIAQQQQEHINRVRKVGKRF